MTGLFLFQYFNYNQFMKILNKFIFLVFFSNFTLTADQDCFAKKVQIMKPLYPYASYQGYAIINYDVNLDGSVSNVKAVDSQCAMSRNDDGSIKFRRCPFFKARSVEAGTLMKYTAPKTSNGKSCILKNQNHRYIFSLYKPGLKDLDFILRDEFVDMIDNAE